MQAYINEYLKRDLPLKITPDLATQIIRMVIQFEIRDEAPLTLNSQMFGVNKFIFTARDFQLFFDIIGYSKADITPVISKIPSINSDFKVISDEFNIMVVYLAHALLISHIQTNLKHDAVISILNYMQYRFMASAVNHYFPHGANYEIMQAVIESLNMKFSVRQSGSWKSVMTERSESITFDTRAHQDTLLQFNKDKDILYLITDTSTRIRSQLKIITSEYYSTRETNTFMTSHSSTTKLEGEKILKEKDGAYATMSSSVTDKVLIKSSFIDERYIRMVQNSIPRLNLGIIRRMLATISDEARNQKESDNLYKTSLKHDGNEIYVGVGSLIDHIIHVIYSTAIHNSRININSKIAVYTNTKNVFSAARSSNQELINVRASLDDLIRRTRISTRESTISGLIVSFSLYITLMSFNAL